MVHGCLVKRMSLVLFLWRPSKLLQGEICQSTIDNRTQLIMKSIRVAAVAFNVSCVYI